jgi:hypothetical protein
MKTLTLALILTLAAIAGAESKYVLNSKRLSTSDLAVSCNNGGYPTGTKFGDTLIISCGR